MHDLAALTQRADEVASILEAHWSEEFAQALADENEAALGFALARCLSLGWIEPGAELEKPLAAAETFMAEYGNGG